ncbi:MAG: hypothetical protein WD403_13355 [Pirellulales bacterium]
MFRFSIRELMLVTLVVAMGVGCGIDRISGKEAEEDARMLAHLTAPGALPGCLGEPPHLTQLREKYGARTKFQIEILEEELDPLSN